MIQPKTNVLDENNETEISYFLKTKLQNKLRKHKKLSLKTFYFWVKIKQQTF